MKTIAIYRVPVRTYTAVELAAMPLSEMQARLEAQEKHAASFNTIGHDAFRLLQLVQGGLRSWLITTRPGATTGGSMARKSSRLRSVSSTGAAFSN